MPSGSEDTVKVGLVEISAADFQGARNRMAGGERATGKIAAAGNRVAVVGDVNVSADDYETVRALVAGEATRKTGSAAPKRAEGSLRKRSP